MTTRWDTIVDRLKDYYSERGRDYPWRRRSDVYGLYLAEILLQRTPADRCVEVYQEIVKRYPTPESMSRAEPRELRSLFSKLGLLKRGEWLKSGCEYLSSGKRLAITEEGLKVLPGVGEYSARAIVVALCGEGRLPVDSNVRRVLTRLGIPRSSWSVLVIPREAFYGLLDLAASHCRSRSPKCECCPLSDSCRHNLRE